LLILSWSAAVQPAAWLHRHAAFPRPANGMALAESVAPIYQEEHMDRTVVTSKIVAAKVRKGLHWSGIAARIGQSKEWTTAACLGQMTFSREQAAVAQELFELTDEECAWLQIVPYKGSLATAVPTDPLIYRWYEIVSVYGTTIKELIHEEFGDGIMSAIDFSMDIQREADPKGDRVNVVLSGKFLPYKSY
jgi:cyanate lyase